MKKKKVNYHESHTASTKKGMGTFYGSGVKNPSGKIRDVSSPGQNPLSKSKLKKPPRSLA